MIKYAYTILYVEDVQKTLLFYEQAFGFKEKFLTPEKDYGEMHSGTTTLAFAEINLARNNFSGGFQQSTLDNKPFGIELTFTTEDVEKQLHKALKEGAILVKKPTVKPWGQKIAYIRDPNGFLIEICTPQKIN